MIQWSTQSILPTILRDANAFDFEIKDCGHPLLVCMCRPPQAAHAHMDAERDQ